MGRPIRVLWCLYVLLAGCSSGGAVDHKLDGGADAALDAGAGLSRADVDKLPAGDAHGSTYSGSYFTSNDVPASACTCRVGTCEPSGNEASPSGVVLVTQSDGRWHMQLRGGINTECDGGIDADGSFWCGTVRDDSTGVIPNEPHSSSRSFLLLTGRATTVDAKRVLDVRADATFGLTSASETYDCDLHGQGRYTAD